MSSDLYEQARALYGQATDLVLRGQLQKALPLLRESVAAHRLLADGRDEYQPDLAIALQGLSAALQWANRLPEAVPSLREELEIRRRLAAGNDPECRKDLARVLSILGTALASVGDAAGATNSGADSVEICRELYTLDPLAYRESLGHALTDMLRIYVHFDLFRDADTIGEDAVEIWRHGDEHHGDKHLGYLAEALEMHAFALSHLDAHEAALVRFGESLEIYQRLGEESRPQFTRGLTAYGRLLGVTGHTREATQCLIKALTLADRYGHEQTTEWAAGLLQDAYHADPHEMTQEWKRTTGTKVPRWLRRGRPPRS
jgi:tetratricopeptide (TPR) repeat protein